jgi:hypothetical protein
MEARLIRTAALAALLVVCAGARYPSANFIVETSDATLAGQIAQAAEKYRHDLAIEWLGQPLPNWSQPCLMTVQVGPHLGAGGATTFVFDRGEVFGWRMTIQGSAERIFDSVLPHEITHMIYASHFRKPLPRWADEGGATSEEHISEKQKHRAMLVEFLRTGRGIAFNQMFAMTEYPRDVMPLYAQGYALSEYLIQHGGRRKYVEFLDEGMRDGQWAAAVAHQYGIADLGTLQNTWVQWVAQGFPEPRPERAAVAATPVSSGGPRVRPEPNLIYRIRDKAAAAPAAAAPQPATKAEVVPAAVVAARTLPADGWRAAGAPPSPPAPLPKGEGRPSQATSEQVARPQPLEPSRQIILEWAAPRSP